MKVLVCGSRTWDDRYTVAWRLAQFPRDTEIIHGAARGADEAASDAAFALGFAQTGYPANWDEHGKAAGLIRNQEMIEREQPDLVLAFWDGKSKGTMHTVALARKRNIRVEIVLPE